MITAEEMAVLREASAKATGGTWLKGSLSGRCNKDHVHRGPPPHGSCKYDVVYVPDVPGIVSDIPQKDVLTSDYDGAVIEDADVDFIVLACNMVRKMLADGQGS